MKTNFKKILIIIGIALVVIGLLIFLYLKYNETKVDWDQSVTNYITLKDGNSSVDGNGVNISGNNIYINYSGIYELTGMLTEGKIVVNIKDKGSVKLILNGVDITSSTLPLYIENTSDTTIILNSDTENILTDSNKVRDEDGVIYSKDYLIIEGTGTLKINSNYADGIVSKDTLTIKDGTYIINSKDDAIIGKDSLTIENGVFNITSKGDGLKSTNDEDISLGYIVINNGEFNITSNADAIQGETSVTIENGVFNIITGGGSDNSSTNSKGMWGNTTTTDEVSAKGIKGLDITIENGTFNLNTSDDAIHSNSTINIKNGTFNIASGDDGIHADTSITIDNGTFNIEKSYEGIESANITLNDGEYHIVSSDDGINVAGGNDESSMGRPGANNMTTSNNQKLTINKGYVYVDATGDGLDANGSIYINGGTVIVNGPTNDGNGALDYDSECIIKGGTLISAGSSGMLQTPSTSSSINTLSIVFDSSVNGIIHIEDESGNEIITFKPSKTIKSLVFSSSLLKLNSTYKVYINGTYSKDATDGIYTNGTYSGILYREVTMTSTVTSIGTSTNNMMGGMRR